MDSFSQGRYIAKALSTGALLLGLVACAEPSNAQQEKAMQEATSADLRREQDRVAALVDAAAPERSAPMMTWDGYPALQPGPELTPDQLQKQVAALAQALHAQADSEPAKVERLLGLALPPDAKGERRGVTGRVGQGTYDWAVWKGSPNLPGHRAELTLTPNACLDYDTLKKQMEANGFRVYVPTFGDDQRITFDKIVGPSLGLYIAATPDRRDAPTCVTAVSFEMERSDA
ncbi:hypothetical protein R5576_05335 [Xanthomonas euvesicatoria]|uniref:Lipoprotein n=1 Tax=Xanthomonas euvesicatoria TaxID=456327 RepID=A0AAX4FMC7_XANEU|nr:hypothetical protein [Xanthomonas euvesicatoria]WOP47250.1 hypothetical protein R2B60_16050 [Xanthomonas euvesicatoria]WOP49299.1 hypothetical protein R2B60_06150 [Xanthomonas euvesicatoria]WOP51410.1 hypothetical protein R5576_15085 [Xanthomonas euvesicatoria]WOP53340.1 hypothetical protein R5576_05335 [Xanthomonas euvesicatoria]WOP55754.1 hypothetical protein R5577_16125 [Xanthomonas euvesicatoria]